MRKSIDGLAYIVEQKFKLPAQSDMMFVFHNRHCDKVKILYWDGDGFCLLYKRLERGQFHFPKHITADKYTVTDSELDWLLHGLRIENKYIGFVVVDGKAKRDLKCNWANKITPMSTTSGMIFHSGELNSPLIKSKNEKFHDQGKHDNIYVDYITSALKFKDIYSSANPLMSMGISIEKDFNKKYSPYLVALSFLRFDVIVENLITILCIEITKIDKEFKISNII